MKKISIKGLNKAEVLAALYNAAKPCGLGGCHAEDKLMTAKDAEKIIKSYPADYIWIDYFKGRAIKVRLDKNSLVIKDYNYRNGRGLMQKVIEKLKTHNS